MSDPPVPGTDRDCPRCGSPVRYQRCGRCRFRLDCPSCHHPLADSLGPDAAGRSGQITCRHCGTMTDQPPWMADPSPTPRGEPTPDGRAVPPTEPTASQEPAPTPGAPGPSDARLAEPDGPADAAERRAANRWEFAGRNLRASRVALGVALVAAGRDGDAVDAYAAALSEPASSEGPPDPDVFVLRAGALTRLGRADAAGRDRINAVVADPTLLTDVAPFLTAADLVTAARMLDSVGRRDAGLTAVTSAVAQAAEPTDIRIQALNLQADLLVASGRRSEAAASARTAAWLHYDLNDFPAAIAGLRRSIELDPDAALTHRYLAEALRFVPVDPDHPSKHLDEALAAWSRAHDLDPQGSRQVWPVQVRSLVVSEVSRIHMWDNRTAWAALLACEYAIALDADSWLGWATLSAAYRTLDLLGGAQQAARRALELAPDESWALFQALLVALFGLTPDRQDLLDRYLASQPPPSREIRVFVLAAAEQWAAARECLAHVDATAFDDPDFAVVASEVHRMTGDHKAELRVVQPTLDRWGDTLDTRGAFSPMSIVSAEFHAHRYQAALGRLDRLAQAPYGLWGLEDLYGQRLINEIHLGRWSDAERSFHGLLDGRLPSSLHGFSVDVERLAAEADSTADERLLSWAQQLAARSAELAGRLRQQPAFIELQQAMAGTAGQPFADDSLAPAALAAGSSRLATASGDQEQAERWAYRVLELAPPGTPDSDIEGRRNLGWQLLVRALSAVAPGSTDDESPDPTRWSRATQALQEAPREVALPVRVRLIAEQVRAGLLDSARSGLRHLFDERAGELPVDASAVAAELARTLPDTEATWSLLDTSGQTAPKESVQLLDPVLRQQLGTDGVDDEDSWWPLPTPVVLLISTDLVPSDTGPDGPMLGTVIPEMRERIRREYGWDVPGIRVREDLELAPSTYRVLLDDTLRFQDRIDRDQVDPDHLDSAGVAAITAVVDQLRQVLVGSLGEFVTFEEVVATLTDLPAPSADPADVLVVLRSIAARRLPLPQIEIAAALARRLEVGDALPALVDEYADQLSEVDAPKVDAPQVDAACADVR